MIGTLGLSRTFIRARGLTADETPNTWPHPTSCRRSLSPCHAEAIHTWSEPTSERLPLKDTAAQIVWPYPIKQPSTAVDLEHLTKPSDLVETDEGAAEDHESLVDVGAAFVADGEAAKAVEPCQCSLHDPAVPAQPFAAVHRPPSDAGRDRTGAALGPAAAVVVSLVGVKLVRALARAATTVAHAWHGVEGGCQQQAVVPVGWTQAHPERCAAPVDHKMALRARFAPIRRVRAGLGTPLFAGTAALSREARLQSRCPASDRRSSSTRWSPAQTPAVCQSRNLRQQVIPEHPNSRGSIS